MIVKWIRILYSIIAWLFPVAILVQVLFAGLSLFTSQPYWDSHITLGHLIGVLPILLVILGYLGRLPRRTIILTWLALGTYLIQAEVFAAIRADVPLFAAFHPVLALVLFVSRDSGVSWTELSSFRRIPSRWFWFSPAERPYTAYVQAIALSPTNPCTVVVGIAGGRCVIVTH